MDTYESKIRDIIIQIAELDDVEEIKDDARFIEDLKYDSIKVINLMALLEEEFQIEFNNMVEFISRFNQVGEFVQYVMECMEHTNKK